MDDVYDMNVWDIKIRCIREDLPNKEIRVSKKVGVHFKQRPLLENESRQDDLRQIHANTNL